MKKVSLLMMALLFQVSALLAIPAHRMPARVQQPDGTFVTISLRGDEWRSYNTTDDGYSVVKDSRGYYVYAELRDGLLEPTDMVAHDEAQRTAAERSYLTSVRKYQAPAMQERVAQMRRNVQQRQQQVLKSRRATDYNNFRGLIILVEYKDRSFSRTDYKDILTDMVNKENYTGFDNQKYSGSVRDYFSDNSGGKFQPHFDVVGPYKINYSQYDANGTKDVDKLLKAAIEAADPDVNFADYDGDNDGSVDLVFFQMAGYGSCYSGNDTRLFWPHRFYLSMRKDGKWLQDYASSVEMFGWESSPSGSNNCIDGIGTICHEFSHVLGLPDFYDTDDDGSGGQSITPGSWSIMAGGSDFNRGRTPVGYSLYERYSVGFYDEPEIIDAEGSYTLEPLYLNGKGYRINSAVTNEFFLFENRQKSAFKWDAYLPGNGMLVHRVDRTNTYKWTFSNDVNANPDRNYYEVLRANGYKGQDSSSDLFPSNRKTALHNTTSPANLLSHDGKNTKWGLTNIAVSSGTITFDIGNTYVLSSLSLPAEMTVGVGLTKPLEAVAEPDFAEYTLTWSSDKESVATVDQQGNVKGVSAGEANVTVTSNNGLTATCKVKVEEMEAVSVAAFKQLQQGTDVLLQLNNAEVLYVYQNTAYLRDAKGSIAIAGIDLGLKQNDIVNGTLFARVGVNNNMVQVVGIDGTTNASGLTVTQGSPVQPREVTLEELTEDDYADYVVVRAVQLERNNGVWAVSGNKRVRLYNQFQISGISVPKNIDGKYYDIFGIMNTNVVNGSVIDELELLKSPEEVTAPQPEPVLNSITLSDQELSVETGENLTLTFTIDPADLTGYTVAWESSDLSVATVDESGLVTALSAGETDITVTVTYKDVTKSATCKVTVKEPEPVLNSITLADQEVSAEAGESITLTFTIDPADLTGYTVAWESSDPSVASVDQTGLVTALSAGETNITVTVTYNNVTKSATCKLTVTETNGIETVQGLQLTVHSCYNLQGQRVDSSKLSKGLYIINGRKVLIP